MKPFLFPLLALCLPFFLSAQQNKLLVTPPEQVIAKPGEAFTEDLQMTVLSGFHVNSDKPTQDYLIPLSVTWNAAPLTVESIGYPSPEQIKVGADILAVFTGKISVKTQFKVPATVTRGNFILTGKIHYQPCNNQMCFRPATIDVRLPVAVQ